MRQRTVELTAENPHPKTFEVLDQEIDCPICGGERTCMSQEEINRTNENEGCVDEEYIQHFLCVRCGFTTTSDMVVGSEAAEIARRSSPKLVQDLKVIDNVRNIVWFPSVINIATKGCVYPDTDEVDWHWVVAPAVPLTKEEIESYLSTNAEIDKYKYRLATEKSQTFDKYDFQNAVALLGALVGRKD